MQHYVGLDVSVKETSVCIVDKAGKVIREVKVATEPVAILAVLTEEALAIERLPPSGTQFCKPDISHRDQTAWLGM